MKKMRYISLLLVLAMLTVGLAGCGVCDHKWLPADCVNPRICNICGEMDGEPSDQHMWEDATTESPKTCSVCGKTEGDQIDVDERFVTSACKQLFGNWETKYETDGSQLSMTGMTIAIKMTMTFTNEGDVVIQKELQNVSQVEQDLAQRMSQMMYEQYTQAGMSKAEADTACKNQYGQTVTEFCEMRAKQVVKGLNSTEEKVYYVADDRLYMGDDWGDELSSRPLEFTEDGKMVLEDKDLDQTLEFIRIAVAVNK